MALGFQRRPHKPQRRFDNADYADDLFLKQQPVLTHVWIAGAPARQGTVRRIARHPNRGVAVDLKLATTSVCTVTNRSP